ncbi:ATP-dependent nuclease [Brucella intermedia]|uniref:ATP-dependent nuclease n=1 Tax=Brucella intermedia TaxID=94625 RepID=UPI0015901B47|nr:ATP-binding protein [Brucella intermedia]
MIKSITVQNFQRVDGPAKLDLGAVNVIVGENGSGKSSLLKAIHWSARCATLSQGGKVTLEQMDFVPSKEFLDLAHKRKLQNSSNGRKVNVQFFNEDDISTSIVISAARNDAGVNIQINGPLSDILANDSQVSTAYIPGLSGMAEEETVLAIPLMRRKAASGEGGSVLRQVILELADQAEIEKNDYVYLEQLSSWVGKVLPDVKFWVKFDRLRDKNIDVKFWTPEMRIAGQGERVAWKSVDMAGTGFLQVVQIFAYLLYFKPRLLLIDEPDAHLHPGRQQRLIRALELALDRFPETQVILTTHSASLVKALSSKATIHWMADGEVRAHGDVVRERMGWNAIDKDIVIFTEDGNTSYLQSIIDQWPEISNKCLLWPVFGKGSLPNGEKAKKISMKMGIKVFIYFDRDFMSDEDREDWIKLKKYPNNDVGTWSADGSDIESLFCTVNYIADMLEISVEIAQEILDTATESFDPSQCQTEFANAYNEAVNSLPAIPGRNAIHRWQNLGQFCSSTIKGKALLQAVSQACITVLPKYGLATKIKNRQKLGQASKNHEIGDGLKAALQTIL